MSQNINRAYNYLYNTNRHKYISLLINVFIINKQTNLFDILMGNKKMNYK